MNTQTGIVYGLTGDSRRGDINRYHDKPPFLKLNKTKFAVDIAGLKKVEQRKVLKFEGDDIVTKFTIGFEVEKNQLHRGAVKEYELFCGFERDGSCGYEAVTHVLPLLPSGRWRTKVFDMMYKAEKIIDDRYSPSNKQCGGHTTLAVDGYTGEQLRDIIRKNSGILYALFRHRLSNNFCRHNNRMQSPLACSTAWHSKYQLALVKETYLLEFRLPSRFETVKQMMRRYELFYELVNFSINKPNGKHDDFLAIIKPIIVSMYNGDVNKAEQIIELAKPFKKYIMTGEVSDEILQYL